jgi:homoprotocatechuate degradation regulator HpaR
MSTRDRHPAPALSFSHRNLPLLLLRARDAVLAQFRPILQAHGVTEQQWRVLRVLCESGPLEPRQIGQLCCISSSSLAGVLARMDELGLVQRQRLAQDARRVRVSPSPASRALVASMAPQIEGCYAEIEQQLGRDFLQRLYRTLDTLDARLATAAAESED